MLSKTGPTCSTVLKVVGEASLGLVEGDLISGSSLASSRGRPQAISRKKTSNGEVDDSEVELTRDGLDSVIYANDHGDNEESDKGDDSINDDEYDPSQDSTRQPLRKRHGVENARRERTAL